MLQDESVYLFFGFPGGDVASLGGEGDAETDYGSRVGGKLTGVVFLPFEIGLYSR